MIVSQKMISETEFICSPNIPVLDVPCMRVARANSLHIEGILEAPSPPSPIFGEALISDSVAIEASHHESVVCCSDTLPTSVLESGLIDFVPKIRSGSYAHIGSRPLMEDEHTCIDDLSIQLGSQFTFPLPSAFYGVFDGHGGPEAAAYVKRNALKLFFKDAVLPESLDVDDVFLQDLENSHRKAYQQADLALANECSVSGSCGTTALTVVVFGRLVLVANVGDCRAVLCRKGQAVEMSQDHRPSYLPERMRVEELGGRFDDGYLNGCLALTRALGDWEMKFPDATASPLVAEPDVRRVILTGDDEFLIIGCDGVWDVMSNQHAVSLVRRGLRRHDDPQQCARELVLEALRLNTTDNITVIVVCFAVPVYSEVMSPRQPRLRCCHLSDEGRNKLKRLLEGN